MTASRKTKTFECEAMSHDLFSTQFAKGGCCDTLTANDFKDPPIVTYNTDHIISVGGVVYAMMEREISMMVTENRANTLTSTDYKGAQVVCHERVLHDRESSGGQ